MITMVDKIITIASVFIYKRPGIRMIAMKRMIAGTVEMIVIGRESKR